MSEHKHNAVLGTLQFEKETKGTYLYKGTDANGRMLSQYVPKTAFPDGRPEEIEVCIGWEIS